MRKRQSFLWNIFIFVGIFAMVWKLADMYFYQLFETIQIRVSLTIGLSVIIFGIVKFPNIGSIILVILFALIWILAQLQLNILPQWIGRIFNSISIKEVSFAVVGAIASIITITQYITPKAKKEIERLKKIDFRCIRNTDLSGHKFSFKTNNYLNTTSPYFLTTLMKVKCFIAVVLLVFNLILRDFSLVISVLVPILGIIFAIQAAFIKDYGEKNRKVFENLCKFLNKTGIYFNVKQILVLIDSAKEDREFFEKENIADFLKKEGISCDYSYAIDNLNQKLPCYRCIVTIYYSDKVPESWINERKRIYRKKFVLSNVIVCTKDNENINKLIDDRIETIDLNQPDYKTNLLNAIKSKFKHQ